MHSAFAKTVKVASNDKDDPLSFMLKLAAGRFKSCPFEDSTLAETRATIREAVGMDANDDLVAEGKVFHLKLLGRLL